MKVKLFLVSILLTLWTGLFSQQLIQGTIKKGATADQFEIWIRPNFSSSSTYLYQLVFPIAFPTSASPQPTGITVTIDPSFISTFGFNGSNNYVTTLNPVATATGGAEKYIDIVMVRSGSGASNTQSWGSGTEYKVLTGTFTYSSGSTNFLAKLADYQDGGSDGLGNFYTADPVGDYFVTANSVGNFYASPSNSIVGGTAAAGYAQLMAAVNAGTVSGTSPLCIGQTASYTTNGDAGGSWSSSNTSVASVNSSTGLVTALAAGTSNIIYTISGVSASKTLTVNPNVSAGTVSGSSSLCIGGTSSFSSNGTAGGSWSSTNTSVATVDPNTGLVTAVSAGTSNITYTVSSGCGSPVSSFATVTVNANVSAGTVSGTSPLCIGGTASYSSNGTSGGTWSSSNTSVATVNASTGLVTAVAPGTANIVYTVNSGCGSPVSASAPVTVNPNVNAGTVSGTSPLLVGQTATYSSNGTSGGTWSSSNTSVATVNASTGLVTAVAAGTTNIIYTVNSGCGAPVSSFASLTVNSPNAGTVSGTSPLCIGATATYTSTGDAGGTWSSTNPSVASVNASTGLVTALSAGTTNITYTVNGASSSQALTVNANVTAGTVSGSSPICIGANATYTSNGTAGGTWSSSNTSVATVNGSTGVVTGVSSGTATITYTVNSGCGAPVSSTASITVSPNVSAGTVSGTASLCAGATATFSSNGTTGGSWSSSNTSVATVNSSTGLVTAVAAGTTNITYTVNSGCGSPVSAFASLTVNASVSAGTISGSSSICVNATTTYTSNGTSGGSWSSSNTSVATVNSSTGLITGVSAGTATITYTVNSGCGSPVSSQKTITIGSAPTVAAISGNTNLTTGTTSLLSDATGGGTWSSNNTSVATVNSSGLVSAVAAGTATISYSVTNSCGTTTVTTTVTVTQAVVQLIQGTIKPGTNPYDVEVWLKPSFSNSTKYIAQMVLPIAFPSNAPVTPTSLNISLDPAFVAAFGNNYVVTTNPIATATGGAEKYIGIALVRSGTGASDPQTWTANTEFKVLTASFAPTTAPGTQVKLADYQDGGSDGLGNFYTASGVGDYYVTTTSTGNFYAVTGLSTVGGTATAGYAQTIATIGCTAPVVNPITGSSSVCVGATTQLSSTTNGGTWSSNNTSVATVSTTGLVTGVSAGTATISYSVTTSCGTTTVTKTITVNANGNAGTVSGTSPLCVGGTTTFTSNGDAGGTWSSSNTSVATINASTGVVSALAAGTTTITYTVSGCSGNASATASLTVNGAPTVQPITGASSVCNGSTLQLSDVTTGGTWSSSNTSVATVDNTGLVTTVSTGTTTISYSVTNSCSTTTVTKSVTVVATAAAGTVSGTSPLCIGSTATYTSNGTSGGSWTSSNTSVASIDANTGLVTALSAGTTTITYTVNGCNGSVTASQTLTVNPNVSAGTVTGNSPLCVGQTTSYTSNGTSGGTWSSDNTSVATVNASTGLVSAVGAGSAHIIYTISSGCGSPATAQATVTVNATASAGTVSGTSPLCIGGTATYSSNGTSGGTWSSSNTSVATVNASSGLVTAVSAGTSTITYTVTSCGSPVSASATVTVNPNVSAGTISGSASICAGSSTTYTSNGTAGGTWSSSNTSVATIDISTGAINAIAAGTTTITYTVTSGCGSPVSATKTLTVNGAPVVAAISGPSSVCAGSSIQLSDGTSGGTWSSNNTSVATVNSTGMVAGISAGTATISYSVTGSCGTTTVTATITVNAQSSAGTVSGLSPICIGTATAFSSTGTSGGSWSSSNPAIASVNQTTGLVTGVSAGTVTITYTVTGCNGTLTASQNLTVNPNVSAGTVSGTSPLCAGSTATYTSNGTAGGTWSSSNTSVATVNSSTGLVTAVAAGTTTITYTVNSGCGSPVSASASLSVTASVSAGTVTGTTPLCIGSTATYTSTGSTGGTWSSSNTSVATVNASSGLVTAVAAGNAIITYTVTGCNGSVFASQNLVVSPNVTAGTVSGTSPLTVGATATYTSNGTSGGTWSSSNTSVATVDPNTGLVSAIANGTTNITYTVNSGCGSPVSASKTLTVNVAGAITVTCPGNISTTTTTCSKSIATSNPSYTGSVVSLTWTMTGATTGASPATGINYLGTKTFNTGVTTVTYTATDAAGNQAMCSFTVTVKEGTLPNINCLSPVTAGTNGGACAATLAIANPTVSDNCGVASVTWVMTGATTGASPSTGINYVGTQTFNKGVTTITYTVMDASGNARTCSFTVTVKDNDKPTVSCPGNITVQTDNGACSKTITLPDPSYSDNCGVTTLSWAMVGATNAISPLTGINTIGTKSFNVGKTIVTYVAADAAGNLNYCYFTVTVTENVNPTITCPGNITASANGNSCSKSIQTANPVFGDNCGVASLTWTMSGATSGSSPSSGTNYVGTRMFNVGVTTVTYTVKDASGNSASCSFAVTVTNSRCTNSPTTSTEYRNPKESKWFNVRVFNNPSSDVFTLVPEGSDVNSAVSFQVTDMNGKVIEVREGIPMGKAIMIGGNYANGTYVVRILQGANSSVVKLIKL